MAGRSGDLKTGWFRDSEAGKSGYSEASKYGTQEAAQPAVSQETVWPLSTLTVPWCSPGTQEMLSTLTSQWYYPWTPGDSVGAAGTVLFSRTLVSAVNTDGPRGSGPGTDLRDSETDTGTGSLGALDWKTQELALNQEVGKLAISLQRA